MAVTISLEDALTGLERELSVPKPYPVERATAPVQNLAPARLPAPPVLVTVKSSNRGFIQMTTTCPSCRGTGQVIADPCSTCQGTGEETQNERVSVKVPPGIDHGMKLRLSGQGEVGPGSQPGDLYVIIRIAEHSNLERHGDDLLGRLELSMYDAALGTKVTFETGRQD